MGDTEQEATAEKAEGLTQILEVAARLGDAHGDEALALKTLENGLRRFAGLAEPLELARAHLYRAELAVRTEDYELARSSLTAAQSLGLREEERSLLAEEFAHISEIVANSE